MLFSTAQQSSAKPNTMNRDEIQDRYKWNLNDIFADWDAWQATYDELEEGMKKLDNFKGTLHQGPERILEWYKLDDELSQMAYKVYYYPSLKFDEDQRENEFNAKRQQVGILFSKWGTATAWFTPELLAIPWETMKDWLDSTPELADYRFTIEDTYRQQEHVLDEDGERLLSYSSQLSGAPNDAYGMLSTADITFPTITLSNGEETQITYGTYYSILSTNRNREDRQAAYKAFYETFNKNINTYAALYNGVCQKDWFKAQARNYPSTLEAKLFGNDIPPEVVETLIDVVKNGSAPLEKYYSLRKKVLGLDEIDLYDGSIPLVDLDIRYDYDEAVEHVTRSVEPLGKEYQKRVKHAFESRWLDVYENEGKRSGAYSAGVYGVHPYMLLNYNDTMNEMFTVAHEMGHTMHTVLSHETQPFINSSYTIFVAEVASTLNEALLLDYMLENTKDPKERILLLEHHISGIVGTFYTQVMFADFELQAHRMVENGQPITADALNKIYYDLLTMYYGDVATLDDLYKITWSRIGHFFRSPYYVYQYATCYASSAKLYNDIKTGKKKDRQAALDRYITLLRSGGNDYPMNQLKKAGVDLGQRETVQAVVDQMAVLVDKLEAEINKL
ncbi:oligoendopeptidase F [bacterium]|nr:oligoendopeptidase F [bacterium]